MNNVTFPLEQFPEDKNYGIVLYSDGGANNDTLYSGWSLHGYLYEMTAEKGTKFKKSKDAFSNMGYVDGRSYDLDKGKAVTADGETVTYTGPTLGGMMIPKMFENPGLKAVSPTHFIDFFGGQHATTNNYSELAAMHRALQLILAIEPVQASIRADSMYVLDGLLKNRQGWESRGGFTVGKEPVKNWAFWQVIFNVFDAVIAKGKTKLYFSHVDGHSGEPGNEKADYNANRGMILESLQPGKEEYRVSDRKGYVQSKKTSSRLLEQRWWYALNNRPSYREDFDPRHIYYFGNHGKAEEEDDQIGKSTATAKVAILLAQDKEPVLELLGDYLKQRHFEGSEFMTLGYLENILQAERYVNIAEDKEMVLWDNQDTGVIKTPDKIPVLKEMRPTYLGFRLLTRFEALVRVIEHYLKKEPFIAVTDITNACLNVTVEGNKKPVVKPTPEVDAPNKTLAVDINYKLASGAGGKVKVKLKLGQDMPLRNTLNATATEEMKIYTITWPKGNRAFNYATIVEVDGDLLFTASLDSNVHEFAGKL